MGHAVYLKLGGRVFSVFFYLSSIDMNGVYRGDDISFITWSFLYITGYRDTVLWMKSNVHLSMEYWRLGFL